MLALYLVMLERPEDEPAFMALYNKYLPYLTHIAYHYFPDNGRADDALQDTWTDIAKDFVKISSIPCHETASYLASIMRNNCTDILRKEGKYTELLAEEAASSWNETEDTVILQDEYRRGVERIRTMPEIYRGVLELRLILGKTNKEAAQRLKISETLAAKRFERGMKMLVAASRKEGAVFE